MPKGAALSEMSSGENISHFAAIRVRVNGTGSLNMTVYSLDDVRSKTLVPITMQASTRIIPTRLVNFTEQRAAFELGTTAIDEKFRINRIVIFMKEVFTSYPG
jgi:hypothetical protein